MFYQGLRDSVLEDLSLKGGEIFAYEEVGGSNLDLPDEGYATNGRKIDLRSEVYRKYDIILCISNYSATAPLTEFAKEFGFRGATMHGVNPVILASGLAVDYNEVSVTAEKLRQGFSRADFVDIDFECLGQKHQLHLELGKQEAQKSHGLCREKGCIANLPAGEIYFVPKSADGFFPMTYENGTLGLMEVKAGKIARATLLRGEDATIVEHNRKLKSDPMTGAIGELGFGTQELPVSGSDIQDEKILGTFHIATGRSDHLGGDLTPDKFVTRKNAAHDDILFAPHKTPAVKVPQVRLTKDGQTKVVIENFEAAPFVRSLLK